MKKMVLLFSVIFLFISCTDNDDSLQEESIVGTWELVEVFGSDGAGGKWTPVENGYFYEFADDNLLLSDRFTCDGNYQSSNGSVFISFDCTESQYNSSFEISFEKGDLILTNSAECDEGCGECSINCVKLLFSHQNKHLDHFV